MAAEYGGAPQRFAMRAPDAGMSHKAADGIDRIPTAPRLQAWDRLLRSDGVEAPPSGRSIRNGR